MTQSEYAQRRALATGELALLVSSPANIRYLTGFTGSNSLLLLLGASAVLFTDGRYKLQAASETRCRVRVVKGSPYAAVSKWLAGKGIRRLGFHPKHLSHADFLSLKGAWRMVPVAGRIESLRMVKSPAEIEAIRTSVATNSRAFALLLPLIRPGVTELDLAAELDHCMRKLGAEAPAFDTIVAYGVRTALPHARPTSKTLTNNGLLLIDVGALQAGYCSDMTRMVFVGRPSIKVRQLYGAVLEAQLAAIDSVREGIPAEAVDRTARRVLRAHKLDRAFVHSCGHGLGLEIHEPPRLGSREETRLKAGMTITIEPGVYLQGFGGIRIEDTVLVTRSGCEVLTPTPKEFTTI